MITNLELIERLARLGQEYPSIKCEYICSNQVIKTDFYGLIRLIASDIKGRFRLNAALNENTAYLFDDMA